MEKRFGSDFINQCFFIGEEFFKGTSMRVLSLYTSREPFSDWTNWRAPRASPACGTARLFSVGGGVSTWAVGRVRIFQIFFNPFVVLSFLLAFEVYLNEINFKSRRMESINDADAAHHSASFESLAGELFNLADLDFLGAKIRNRKNTPVIHPLEMIKLYCIALGGL